MCVFLISNHNWIWKSYTSNSTRLKSLIDFFHKNIPLESQCWKKYCICLCVFFDRNSHRYMIKFIFISIFSLRNLLYECTMKILLLIFIFKQYAIEVVVPTSEMPLLRLAAKEALFHKQQIWRRAITVLTISTRLFSNTVKATINMKALIDCKKLALEFTRLQNLTGTTFSDNFSPWITILIFLIAILILLFAIK